MIRRGAAAVFVCVALLSLVSLVVLHQWLITGGTTTITDRTNSDVLILQPPLPLAPKVENRDSVSIAKHGKQRNALSDSQPGKPYIVMHYGPAKTGTSTLQNEMTVWKDRIYQLDNLLYGGVYYDNLQWMGRMEIQKSFLDPGFQCSREMAKVRTQRETNPPRHGMPSLREAIRGIPCVKDLVQDLEPYRTKNTSLFFSNEVKSLTSSFKPIPGYSHKVTQDWLSLAAALGDEWNFLLIIGYRPYLDWVASAKSQNEKFTPTKPRLTKWPGQGGREFPPLFPPSTLSVKNHTKLWEIKESDLVHRDASTSTDSTLKEAVRQHLNFVSAPFQFATTIYEASHKYIPVRFLHLYDSIPIRTNLLCHILPNTRESCRASIEQDQKDGNTGISYVNQGFVVAERSWYDQLAVEAVKQNLVLRSSVTRAQLTSKSMWHHHNVLNGSKWDLPYLCPDKEAVLAVWDLSWEKEQELLGKHANKTRHIDIFQTFLREGKHCNIDAKTAIHQGPWCAFFRQFAEQEKKR